VGALIFSGQEKQPPRSAKVPRYFFNVVESATKNITKDSDGVVLDDVHEAEKEAIGFARDLVEHKQMPRTWKVVVTDENGVQVLAVPLSKIRVRSHLWLDLRGRFVALESKLGPRTLAGLIAIAVVVIIAQASMKRAISTKEEGRYQTAASAAGAPIVAVRFAPQAIAADIAKFLDEYNAALVGGPRPNGLYRLRIGEATISQTELAKLVERMAREEVLEFVAAVQQ
jgi:hypothetical protein